ncbi:MULTISPECIES: hypothetical protein [Methylobacteriaceae]|uniref:Uncharacterized protein n=2 Tax=Methylobacteriaceae TaxID=119045 RepID=A0AA37HPI7_9HYPH|nr:MULTISPECIES: hypothetical protein [Methylobacteriaceae]MDQ0520060.1 hypothetical protein [Methylobacterium gregans]BAU90654.1 hypothetical protein MPPM_2049 [Methylorubrum populi]GJD79176.1 hypothetical protein NBEOAGPD_2397 [Methylobacterium gregans]GLS52461.1 hypothetical protein GCM10007886_06440 [Methylobacterium gregans]
MARPPLPAHDLAAHRAWVASAAEAPFHRPVEPPLLVHPKPKKAPAPERPRDLVDMMEAPAAPADERPWYVRQRMPFDEMMRAHFGGLISPPSELAQKRARLKRERSEAAIAARAAAQAPEEEDEDAEADEVEAPPPPAPELAPPATEPDPYLAGLGLSMLQGLREPRCPEADAALDALDARRPPGFPTATRMLSLRSGEAEANVVLLLATGEEARVTVRWRAVDPAYEWRVMGQLPRTRYCWAADTGEWIPLRL